MKTTLFKIMLALGCAATFAVISGEAQAYYYWHHGHRYYYGGHRVYYRTGYHHPVKKCAGGFWRYGVWHPVRCWY